MKPLDFDFRRKVAHEMMTPAAREMSESMKRDFVEHTLETLLVEHRHGSDLLALQQQPGIDLTKTIRQLGQLHAIRPARLRQLMRFASVFTPADIDQLVRTAVENAFTLRIEHLLPISRIEDPGQRQTVIAEMIKRRLSLADLRQTIKMAALLTQ